jgi:hypothetical protein
MLTTLTNMELGVALQVAGSTITGLSYAAEMNQSSAAWTGLMSH